jgi:N-acetylmuramoyl-L-alanine amidase CwlA
MLMVRPNTRPGRPIKTVRKLVLHDPGNEQTAQQVLEWFNNPDNKRMGSYHDIIEGRRVFGLIPYNELAYHAGTFEYCPHWPEIGQSGMQNHFSLGICLIRGQFEVQTVVSHLTKLCQEFHLNPHKDILCHYHIDSNKKDPQIFYVNQLYLEEIKNRVALGADHERVAQ